MEQYVHKLEQKKESQKPRQKLHSNLTQNNNNSYHPETMTTQDPSKKTERNIMIFLSSTAVLTIGLLLTPLMISSKK